MIIKFFKKTFNIRDGEIRVSFFMQLYIFLIITVLLMVKPTVNALFLSQLGAEHLANVYILTAIVAVVTSYFYTRAIKRFSLLKITMGTLLFFSAMFFALMYLLGLGGLNDWLLYVYYLSVALFAVLTTSQFWIMANMVYNAREAKRLFGFIGSGAIAGGIFGGYLTTFLAHYFGNRVVILVAAILILFCIPIVQTVWKLRIWKLGRYVRSLRNEKENKLNNSSFSLIIKSKHLSLLAAIVGVGVIVAKLVDFQFSDFAHMAIPDSDELASFFGFWFSTFNVMAFIIQLLLTNRMLAWLGVTSNLLVLPMGIALGCLLFLTFPELWVLIIIKGMDGSFKQSVNKAAIELSILPIPISVKNEAKSYIDVVVDSIATGFAGLLLLFVIKKLDLNTSYITILILLFLFIWILLIYKLRDAYFESFRRNIQNSLAKTMGPERSKRESSFKSTIAVLSQGTEMEILKLLERLSQFPQKKLEPYYVKLLDHPSSKIKAATIEQLGHFPKGVAAKKIESLLEIKDDEVVLSAIDYLLNNTNEDDDAIYDRYLDHPVDYIANAALLCLAKETEGNRKMADRFKLHFRIDQKIKEFYRDSDDLRMQEIGELLVTIAYAKEPQFYSYISIHFSHRNPYLVKQAIHAAGITAHEPFVDPLLSFLADQEFRKAANRALKAFGHNITKSILTLDLSQSLSEKIKPFIPRVIEEFGNKEAVSQLKRLMRSKDFVVRAAAAKSLRQLRLNMGVVPIDPRSLNQIILKESRYYQNTLVAISVLNANLEQNSDENDDEADAITNDINIAREGLLELLETQLNQSLECIFNLLTMVYEQADVETAFQGLRSEVEETKINALEFLDNLLNLKLKSTLLPLIEYHVISARSTQIAVAKAPLPKETVIIRTLTKNRGARMKLAALSLMRESKDKAYAKTIKELRLHKNPKVSKLAALVGNEREVFNSPL